VTGDEFDDLDRALVHALQVDARSPFRRIGEVLGVSDQTVARRYGRLRDRQALRVLGLTDPVVVDERQWIFRVRVAPDVVREVADGLAARSDTSWIALCAGGAELVGTAYGEGAEALLLDEFPRTRHVHDVRADQVLRIFYGGAGEPFTKQGPLSDDQVAELARHLPEPTGPAGALDAADRRIVAVLRGDGRASVEALVASTGLSAATVRRRLHDLRAGGAVRFDVDLDMRVLRLPLRTLLRLTIAPGDLPDAGRQLAAHPEVAFAAATTGESNLFASIASTDPTALYDYLTTRVATLPGVQSTATTPVLRTVKAAATRYGVRVQAPGRRRPSS
jgi:DNA-binding Lrp family transcriptional regulator